MMPQGPARLRQKFMTEHNDGIERCERIIEKAGGKIKKGVISFPSIVIFAAHRDLRDAIDYLCLEWDYSLEGKPMSKDKADFDSMNVTQSKAKPMANEQQQRNREARDAAEMLAEQVKLDSSLAHSEQMSKNKAGGATLEITLKDIVTSQGNPDNGATLEGYEHLDYKPLWDFILAKPVKRSETKGGVALPDNAKLDDTFRCLVVKAGPGFYQNGVFIHNPIKVGQYIYNMSKHLQPYKVMLGTELYLSMASSEVLAVASTSGLEDSEDKPWNLPVEIHSPVEK